MFQYIFNVEIFAKENTWTERENNTQCSNLAKITVKLLNKNIGIYSAKASTFNICKNISKRSRLVREI